MSSEKNILEEPRILDSKTENQEDLEKSDHVWNAEDIIKFGKETIEKIKNKERDNHASYESLFLEMKKYGEDNPEDFEALKEFQKIQKEINNLFAELKEKINKENKNERHPSPEEIKSRIISRESNEDEKNRLQERIPSHQKEALKLCASIFNKCDYPWYLTGSIAFLINANESKKQPDDIDIIFHEKDFAKMTEEFGKIGFKTGIAETTGCPFIKGKIKIEIQNKDGEIEEKMVEMEAFGQKTEEPNGLINPGSKDTKYEVIKNKLSENENEDFNILDRSGQIELYFKNLSSEIKNFNLDHILDKIKEGDEGVENKSKKFINRLANLFELNNNNPREVIGKARRSCKSEEDVFLLRRFIDISKNFTEKEPSGEGLTNVLDDGELQASVEKLKEIIDKEINGITKSYQSIIEKTKNIENIEEEERKDLIINIENEILSKRIMINNFLNYHEDIDKTDEGYKDLPLYIFINEFKDNFVEPFCKKLSDIDNKLNRK
ncbi:hypothetical protein CVU82_02565 [Candidatus Falkowbacteria bacterium HGW-Falkowbacteria-1]|jgi:hypothetical protein|uniref:Uncharacterized protein n=1 Tax=Candidatus Falkowbacteria bacterium HGW-Falkowbacteria-1 TaxID=2013768 RepID=A0A2N2E9Q6_9BACT|nr:MAG: hypothetical protein CVU82_02565 [Candidatus Falkowbacteria bacterium HGW-Falkowbacteria-1]